MHNLITYFALLYRQEELGFVCCYRNSNKEEQFCHQICHEKMSMT